MDFLMERAKMAIWGFFSDLAADMLKKGFELMMQFVMDISTSTNYIVVTNHCKNFMSKYFDVEAYTYYIAILSGTWLLCLIAWQFFKHNSGLYDGDEVTIDGLIKRSIWASFLIFFLPFSFTYIMLPLNNYLCNAINVVGTKLELADIGTKLHLGSLTGSIVDIYKSIMKLSSLMITSIVVFAVCFIILAFVSFIRYVELIIAYIISYFVATSAVNQKGDAVEVWIKETLSIVFTQSLHIFLLKIMFEVMARTDGIVLLIGAISVIVVMIRGPHVVRKFCYSTGSGNTTVNTVGSAGRMAAMKYMLKSAKPI